MDAIRLGRGVRALRQRRGWRQQDLADAAGVSRSVIARIEQGRADRVTLSTLDAITHALGARLDVRVQWHGEELDRLIDARHASLVELVVAELTASGWSCAPEVTFQIFGSADRSTSSHTPRRTSSSSLR